MDQSWIMIKSSTEFELVETSGPFFTSQSAGDGLFGVAEDREKLAPVLQMALMRKLKLLLGAQDLIGYRVLLNLQNVRLRGFDATPTHDLIPGFELQHGLDQDAPSQSAQRFLYQQGFTNVNQVDRGGWAPLHYACLRGDPLVIQGLLKQRANVNRWTRKDLPQAGLPAGMTASGICSFYKNHEAFRLLISARASVEGGMHPALSGPGTSDDPEGVRILCQAGCQIWKQNLLGDTAFEYAAAFGSPAALEELVFQAGADLHHLDTSLLLYYAAAGRGGSAELIHRLLDLRADVNATSARGNMLQRMAFGAKALQHRYGKSTLMSRWAYHRPGQTALMAAIMTGQYEGAAALIAAGARLDLRNSRNFTAADFAIGQSIPQFLTEAFEGNLEGCQRIAACARANDCVEL